MARFFSPMCPGPRPLKEGDCPCGSGKSLAGCCGRFLDGGEFAPTPEALMRSRYTAYVLGRTDYLVATWHAATRPAQFALGNPAPRWLGLDVRRVEAPDARRGIVEFVARYRVDGRGHRLHETSRFVREGGRWYYVDGDVAT